MTGLFEAIAGVFGFGRAALEKARQREALKNAPDKQAAAEAVNREEVVEQLRRDINSENLEKIRSDIAAPDIGGRL